MNHIQASEEKIVGNFNERNFFNDLTCGQWSNANANAPLSPEGCRREAELVIGEINRTEAAILRWLRTALREHSAVVLEEANQQKHYELAVQAQAIEAFFKKDADEYGETPLHSKFRAFFARHIQTAIGLTRTTRALTDKENV